MEVKLISTTKAEFDFPTPKSLEGKVNGEELIVWIARVSNPSNQSNLYTAPRLIRYLIDHLHWSPFEMVDMTVEIKTSRAIAQQILRHRSFSFQEFSQRYSTATELEPVELRRQAIKNRQSSTQVYDPFLSGLSFGDNENPRTATYMIRQYLKEGMELYDSMIRAGVAKECARFILPLTTQTTIYMKGSLRSWIHYLGIRADEHSQLEHQRIAFEIKAIFKEQFPNVYEAVFGKDDPEDLKGPNQLSIEDEQE